MRQRLRRFHRRFRHTLGVIGRRAHGSGRRGPGGPGQQTLPASARTLRSAARGAGWTLRGPNRAFLTELAGLVQSGRVDCRVAVLAGDGKEPVAPLVAEACPGLTVTAVPVSLGESAMHTELAAHGRYDLIVDDSRSHEGRARLFTATFPHLRPGGRYLARRFAGRRPVVDEETLLQLLARLMEVRHQRRRRVTRGPASDETAWADSLTGVQVRAQHVLVTTAKAPAWAKLTEAQVGRVLEIRGRSTGRELTRMPATELVSRCQVTESPRRRGEEGPPQRGFPASHDVPSVVLREYSRPLCVPGQIVTSGNLLLPDTFRHHVRSRMGHRLIRDVGPRFGRLPAGFRRGVRDLDGPFFYLDSEFRGHFGHAMTEQLSRLWAWPEAKQREPGLRALMSVNQYGPTMQAFEPLLYAAAGIDPDNLVLVDGPVRPARLLAATPMFAQPNYAHPALGALWGGVGRRLEEQAPDRDYPERVFVARRGGNRVCRNAGEVEPLFVERGFSVVHPGELSLPEQAATFRRAEVVAGWAGSSMFGIMLADRPAHVVLISSDTYTARNEYLMAAVQGHRMDVVWCASDCPMPLAGFSTRAFVAPFSVDMATEGRYLVGLLDSLDQDAGRPAWPSAGRRGTEDPDVTGLPRRA